MSELKKFIVTLHRHEDLESFYEDMETEGGGLYYPNRAVDLLDRRPLSRNTHYLLTAEEAELLKSDPRVWDVTPEELILFTRKPSYTQTSSNWNKLSTVSGNHVNWGLLRCFEGQQRSNWGEPPGTGSQTGTITVNAEGKNVDVVIVDGHFNPAHPEYAVNSDGTGGSRVNQFNWLSLNPQVTGTAASTYVYTPYVDGSSPKRTGDNNHGAHVAGTVAGNTQGWARSANIFNINPYGSNPNTTVPPRLWDYIKAWHNGKSVNPATGRKNPTILNCSFGYDITFNDIDDDGNVFGVITSASFRGVDIGPIPSGLSTAQLNANGIYDRLSNRKPNIPFRPTSDVADIQDLLNAGIIIVAAAGNSYFYTANSTDQDWDNIFIATANGTNYYWYTHRGSSPASISTVISVGAVGNTVNETKATFSNNGPGIDIFAPGVAIMSSVNNGGVADPRNSSFQLQKYQGTSMASPQVCGLLACVLEVYPNMTQTTAQEYLNSISKLNQMTSTGGSFTDETSLNGATNRYLTFRQERPTTGDVFPKKNYFVRPTSGAVYPRTRVRRTY